MARAIFHCLNFFIAFGLGAVSMRMVAPSVGCCSELPRARDCSSSEVDFVWLSALMLCSAPRDKSSVNWMHLRLLLRAHAAIRAGYGKSRTR